MYYMLRETKYPLVQYIKIPEMLMPQLENLNKQQIYGVNKCTETHFYSLICHQTILN